MKHSLTPALLFAVLACAVAANAQPVSPIPAPSSTGAASPAPTIAPAQTPIFPGSLSGSSPAAPAPASPEPARSGEPAASPAPKPSPTSPDRFHLHRPGTDVDGDRLNGNAASDVYVFRGNVILQSDPKVDRAFGAATESDDPITVSADEIDVDRTGMTYVAKGHVHFVQGARSGNADTAMLDEQAHTLDLLGNADVLEGEHRARAAKMHYNLADRQFHGAGDVRIYQPVPTPDPKVSSSPPPKRKRRLPI